MRLSHAKSQVWRRRCCLPCTPLSLVLLVSSVSPSSTWCVGAFPTCIWHGYIGNSQGVQTLNLRASLDNASDGEEELAKQLMQMALAPAISQALHVFVDLEIPDILSQEKQRGLSTTELAEQIRTRKASAQKINRDSLLLNLRILNAAGVVAVGLNDISDSDCRFRLTPMGMMLQNTSEASLAPMIRYFLDESIWKAWHAVPAYVEGREPQETPFSLANGMSSQQYFSDPEHAGSLAAANSFVRYVAEKEVESCVQGVDWESLSEKTVVDIGGFSGKVMAAVAARHSQVKCICLDLPDVVNSLSTGQIASAVTLVGGDMFDHTTIPYCECIFMKHIVLCDWDEGKSLEIMRSCYKALPPRGLVIIAESILPSKHGPDTREAALLSLSSDYFMMLDGRQPSKTEVEWERFASASGFAVESISHTSISTCSLLVLRKKAKKK